MLIQLKVIQNETKNTLKLNSLITSIHPVKKKKRKKEAQLNFTNPDVRCLSTWYLFLVDRTSKFVRCIKINPYFGLKLLWRFLRKVMCDIRKYIEQFSKLLFLKLHVINSAFPSAMHVKFEWKCFAKYKLPWTISLHVMLLLSLATRNVLLFFQ